MNRRAVCLWILFWMGAVISTFGQGEKIPVNSFRFREAVEEKKIYYRVNLAEPVTIENVTATANGAPLPTTYVPFGAPGESDAVSMLFLIDKSDPKRAKTIDAAKALTQQLIERSAPHTEAAVYAFDANLELVADFGTPWADVATKLKTVKAAGMATELYRNAIAAIGILEKRPAVRRALFILSDGKAEDTTYTLEKVVEEAERVDVAIYGIGYAESPQTTIYLQSLRRLATESYGYFAEADPKTRKVPDEFLNLIHPNLRSGGFATVDVSGNQTAKEIVLNVTFQDHAPYQRTFALQKLIPPPLPPAPVPDPQAEEMAKKVAEMAKKVEDVANQVKEVPGKVEETARKAEEERKAKEIAETAEIARQANAAEEQQHREASSRRFRLILLSVLVMVAAITAAVWFLARRRVEEASLVVPPAPDTVFARLQVLDGEATEHRMTTTALRIGRGKDNDLTLGNDSVSRHHAEISRTREGLFTITELNAGNGVLVNGKQVEKAVLQHEDIIELGEVRIRFLISEGQPRTVMT